MLRWRAGTIKAPGEKLLRVRFAEEEGRIVNIAISGDFFMHPEDGIERLQDMLAGLPPDEKIIAENLKIFISGSTIELVGISAESIARVIATAQAMER